MKRTKYEQNFSLVLVVLWTTTKVISDPLELSSHVFIWPSAWYFFLFQMFQVCLPFFWPRQCWAAHKGFSLYYLHAGLCGVDQSTVSLPHCWGPDRALIRKWANAGRVRGLRRHCGPQQVKQAISDDWEGLFFYGSIYWEDPAWYSLFRESSLMNVAVPRRKSWTH